MCACQEISGRKVREVDVSDIYVEDVLMVFVIVRIEDKQFTG